MRITIETATGTTPIDNDNIFEITIDVDDIKRIGKAPYNDKHYVTIDLSSGEYYRLAYPERDYEKLLSILKAQRID